MRDRVAHLVLEGVSPERILLLTFTRRAAQEMTRRAQRIVAEALEERAGARTGQAAGLASAPAVPLSWSGTFHAIANRLRLISGERLQIPQGSLYPSLHRLERKGLLTGEWASTDTGREARVYRLTAKGRRQLSSEITGWSELSTAIALVLGTAVEVKP